MPSHLKQVRKWTRHMKQWFSNTGQQAAQDRNPKVGKEGGELHGGCRTLMESFQGSAQGGNPEAKPNSPPERRGRDTMAVTAHGMQNQRGDSAEREGSSENQFLYTNQNTWIETEPKLEPPKAAEETTPPVDTEARIVPAPTSQRGTLLG